MRLIVFVVEVHAAGKTTVVFVVVVEGSGDVIGGGEVLSTQMRASSHAYFKKFDVTYSDDVMGCM